MNRKDTIYDVLIIGAGPAGLATAARLCESKPSALFTDDEHSRFTFLKRHTNRATIRDRKTGQVTLAKTAPKHPEMLVLDSSGDKWMARWNRFFDRFQISHLRSPMFFHIDPQNKDGMWAFTFEQKRQEELIQVENCVGRELTKHKQKKKRLQRTGLPTTIDERDRKDYFRPSSKLFKDYCKSVIDRYGLSDNLVRHEAVQDIDYGIVHHISLEKPHFTVTTNKSTYNARAVVLAIGAGNSPCIPDQACGQGACHVFQIATFPDPSISLKMEMNRQTNVVVVGGGLTSAQVTDMAIRYGITKVWHIMRSECKVKHFDVTLDWLAKYRNQKTAAFWGADGDEDRLEQIKIARNGGSITSEFDKKLKKHISNGRVSLHTHTTIKSQSYNMDTRTWRLVTDPPIPNMPPVDYIYYATGIQSDFQRVPLLKTMCEKFPIDSFGGLPAITNDLMWTKDVPLFVTGRFASLRVGPAAANLEGARQAAERIVWAYQDLVSRQEFSNTDTNTDEEDHIDKWDDYCKGLGSRFDSLAVDSDDESS